MNERTCPTCGRPSPTTANQKPASRSAARFWLARCREALSRSDQADYKDVG